MRVSVSKITSAINKINDITSGDKQIPGVMLDLSENLLKVCYSDGHKSFIEHIDVETEETDKIGAVVVDFTQIKRAIDNCQPSGIIKIDEIVFEYKEKVITISADQTFSAFDSEGNEIGSQKMGKKSMDLAWVEPGSDMKSSILLRMKYDDIFESDGVDDEFDKKELLDALGRTSVEKGKQVYLSTKTQTVFVANQAHVTSVPISKGKKLNQEELDTLRAEMVEAGTFTEDAYKEAVNKAENRMHYAVVMTQAIAKSVIGVFGKVSSDKVYLHTKDKFCSIFVDTEDEHIGFWFEMAQASKAHIGSLERYNSLKYQSYQTSFLREFLANNVKSALNVTKSEKVTFEFAVSEETGMPELVIAAGSSAASVSDTYRTALSTMLDPENTLMGKKFTVSLKVFSDMLDQLKTDNVTLDFECTEGATCIRLAELDLAKETEKYNEARNKTKELCVAQGIEFISKEDAERDPEKKPTPTPVELRWAYREETLNVKQFTMLAK